MGEAGSDDWPLYGTNEEKEYRFRELKGKNLRFLVKAAHDCHLAFTSGPEETDPMVEVFIGGWEGESSAVRLNKSVDLVKIDSPGILSEEEFREFWISFDNDEIRVGKGGDYSPFMSCPFPEPFRITNFGYSTGWGASGWFQFHNERRLQTDDSLVYSYEPVYGDTFTFGVTCGNDAHLALTSGPEETTPMYEVFIGGWENQKSAIRLSKENDVAKVDTENVVCADNERTFWISFKDGNIRAGNFGEADPFIEWTDPEPWKVTHVGFCTGWGAHGQWRLEV